MISTIFPKNCYPKIFEITSHNNYNYSLNELIKMKTEKKTKNDQFINEYKSSYPFCKETSIKMINKIQEKGKIKLFELFLFWFPEQYFFSQEIFDNLLSPKKGFIPITWKYYLAIMAASTIKNEFLIKYLEKEFLLIGGNEEWLIKGLEAVPEKLKKIDRINNIIAHQPWKLKENDIMEIYLKKNANILNTNELLEAILILINFHRLATILESMRFSYNFFRSNSDENEKISEEKPDELKSNNLITILETLNGEENDVINKIPRKTSDENENENVSSSKFNCSFENKEPVEDFSKHISNFCTVYLDFDSYSDEYLSCLVIFF